MKGKQPTVKMPDRSSANMTRLSSKGNDKAKGKASNRHATMEGWPYRRNKKY